MKLRNIQEEYKVIVLSIIMGIALWTIDALMDAYVFFDMSFWDAFIFQVSGHELFFRLIFLAGFAAFGIVISGFITRHKKIENRLSEAIRSAKEEKAKSESIIAAISDGISVQNTSFEILYQNQVHENMVGSHIGEYCYRAYENRSDVCPECPVAKSFSDGKIHVLETSFISRKTGKLIHAEIISSPIRNSGGDITAAIEVVRDISDRKEKEEAIELSKKEWVEAFDTIDDIITIHDEQFNIIRANKASESTFGIAVNDVIKSKCFRLFHGKNSPPDNCPSCKCMENGKPVISEYYEPNLNRFLEIKAIPRLDADNRPIGIIHVVRDISERKEIENELANHREHLAALVKEKTSDLTSAITLLNDEINSRRKAEEALRLSEKKYRDLYNNAPDMYHTLNENNIIISCNETEATMLGYTKEEIIGRPLADFFTESSKKLLKKDFPILKQQKVLKNIKRTFVRKNGSTFPARINVYADFDENGVHVRTRAIARDVTDLERVEEEATRSAHLASLGELAAGVAHEINNPINGIINYADILLRQGAPGSKEKDIAGRIIKEGDRIANIVRSLLSFARQSHEDKKPVAVKSILDDALALTEAQLRKDGIQLDVQIQNDIPLLFAQPQHIEQVFLNLISNARYALNERFPHHHEDKIFTIHADLLEENHTPHIRICFYDRGSGISDDIKDKIMNPFFSTKPGTIGTGLGLSISHGIISDHDGRIFVESSLGKYTRVAIILPAYSREPLHEK